MISSVSVVRASIGIAGASLTLAFSLATEIITKLLSITKIKTISKLSSIENLVSKALTDTKISHEEFISILKGTNKYEKIKENGRSVTQRRENARLNSVNKKNFFVFVYIKCI